MTSPRSLFGERLRALRRAAGLTLEQLADASGVSDRAISDMERGRSRAPQARTLAAFADGLDLTDDDRAALLAAGRGAIGWPRCVPPPPMVGTSSSPTPSKR